MLVIQSSIFCAIFLILLPFAHCVYWWLKLITIGFQIVLPFLILHAEDDRLCDVEGSRLMYKKAKSKDKHLITFPNAGHNLVRFFIWQMKSNTCSENLVWLDL
jgi:pimeloyl-ACP methyl ester carboxylesterase